MRYIIVEGLQRTLFIAAAGFALLAILSWIYRGTVTARRWDVRLMWATRTLVIVGATFVALAYMAGAS